MIIIDIVSVALGRERAIMALAILCQATLAELVYNEAYFSFKGI